MKTVKNMDLHQEVIRLWGLGFTATQVARGLNRSGRFRDVTKSVVLGIIHRSRAWGYDIPTRRPGFCRCCGQRLARERASAGS